LQIKFPDLIHALKADPVSNILNDSSANSRFWDYTSLTQSAFCPATIVPGIDFSNDKILQCRVFSYTDTQRYHLGTNYLEIPINRPKVSVNNNQQDGFMQILPNHGSINYYPNTLEGGLPKQATETGIREITYVKGNEVRKPINKKNDYAQAGERYCSLNSIDQDYLVSNIVESLSQAIYPIQERMLVHFMKANKEFGKRIEKGLKI